MKRIMAFLLIIIVTMALFLNSCNGTVSEMSAANPSEDNSIADIESKDTSLPENSKDDSDADIESGDTSVPEQSDQSADDVSEPVDDDKVLYDKKHLREYSAINFAIIEEMLSREEFSYFFDMNYGTFDGGSFSTFSCNYGDICDYYRIPKSEFVSICYQYADSSDQDDPDLADEIYMLRNGAEAWYADLDSTAVYEKYSDIPMQLVHEDQSVFLYDKYEFTGNPTAFARDKNDAGKYTNRYYTIDSALIDFVGVKQFSDYYDKYAYTADFNIVSFMDYFEISKEEYMKLYQDLYGQHYQGEEGEMWIYHYPYNPEYLFGTEEMQNMYFCRHDRTQK